MIIIHDNTKNKKKENEKWHSKLMTFKRRIIMIMKITIKITNKDILEDKETALITDISKNLCPQNVPVF